MTGGSGPYTFVVEGTPPLGLSFVTTNEAAGTIELTGTPTQAGTSSFAVEAHSSSPALSIRREYTLTVQLALDPASLGKATALVPYRRQLTSAGGPAPTASP